MTYMTKKQLLEHLKNNVYCRPMPSSIHGIGIFAIREIPKGVNPFIGCYDGIDYKFSEKDLSGIHPAVRKLVEDYCVKQNGYIYINASGMYRYDIGYFLNHSDNPNITTYDNSRTFITTRLIKEGEEITSDYGEYDDDAKS